MTAIDWGRIKNVSNSLEDLGSDDIDIMYELMSTITDVEKIQDLEKLQDGLQVALYIMMMKGEECNTTAEELNEAKIEIKKLQDVKKELEGENADLQRAGEGDGIEAIREKRNWESELNEREDEIKRLKSDNNMLRSEKDARDSRVNDLEKEVDRLRDENKKLADNVEFLRTRTTQLKTQQDQNQDSKKSELAYTRSELRQKKIDLDNAQERILELHREIDNLKENLQQATNDIERLTEDYKRMKNNYGSNDMDLQSKETQIKMLQAQLEHLQDQLSDKNEADDQIMNHVNTQVEKWKQIMSERDSEIVKLYQENEKLRRDLQATGVSTEKANVQALIKLVKEREEQIKELSGKLVEATQTIEENCELIGNLKTDLDKTGGGSTGHQMRRIKELRQILDDKDKVVKDLQQRLDNIEDDSEVKERELRDALDRNKQYEKGEYGLAEAVGEIKGVKAELLVKDRQIENLCQEINKTNFSIEELKMENGHLRHKLGIPLSEVLDTDGYKRQKASEEEQERAMNIVLQKEIEKLEDERLILKKKVRILARQAGLRAGSAGMDADDVMEEIRTLEYEECLNPTKESLFISKTSGSTNRAPPSDRVWKIKEKEASKELNRVIQDLEKKENENIVLTKQNEEMQREHDAMVEALKQLRDDLIRTNTSTHEKVIECPALDRLLSAMETKKLIGSYDNGLYMKSRIDNLEGRNAELRDELRDTRVQLEKFRMQYERQIDRNKRLQNEFGGSMVRGMSDNGMDEIDFGAGDVNVNFESNNVSGGNMAQTVAALNHHLILVMQEKSLRETELEKVDNILQRLRRKFAVVRHQQGLMYREYLDLKQKYQNEIGVLKDKLGEVENIRAQDSARLAEFDKLLDMLSKDESTIKQELGERIREITLFKVNEKVFGRKLAILDEMERISKRENNKLKNEMIQIEATVTERMGYYRRFKETANFKLNILQKELDNSVPKSDLSKLQSKFDELTEKYRNFLDRQNHLISRGQSTTQLESEYNKLKLDHESVKKLLETEKQKRMVLEEAMNELEFDPSLDNSKITHSSDKKRSVKSILNDAHLISITKKVATLEIKELNERERAEHYMRQYDNIRHTFDLAESRNRELEEKVSTLTQSNLELQRLERELRDELEESVSKEVRDNLQNKLNEVERCEMIARHENERYREIADIASSQNRTLLQQQLTNERESDSVRHQLLELESVSDEKMLVGKLQRLVMQLKRSENCAIQKMEESNDRIKMLESQLKQEEIILDNKDQTVFCERQEAHSRTKHLRDTVNTLRSQYSGSIPLMKQEKFTVTLIKLTEEKSDLEKRLQTEFKLRFETEGSLEEEKLIEQGRIELANALKNSGNEKNTLVNWHKKMEQLRIDELRQRRQVDLLQHQLEHLENVSKCQEKQLSYNEEETARLIREHDERELNWEERIGQLEKQLSEIWLENRRGSSGFGIIQGQWGIEGELGLLDSKAPLPNQLEHAIQVARKQMRLAKDHEVTNKTLNSQNDQLNKKIREMESTLLQRERYITELRLRLPASVNRVEEFDKIMVQTEINLTNNASMYYGEDKAVSAAIASLAGYQERMKIKDECIRQYEQLLKESRDELLRNNKLHSKQVADMELMLQKDRENRNNSLERTNSEAFSKQLYEMEDLLKKNTNELQNKKMRIKEIENEIVELRVENETQNKICKSLDKENKLLGVENQTLQKSVENKNAQLDALKMELKTKKRPKKEINENMEKIDVRPEQTAYDDRPELDLKQKEFYNLNREYEAAQKQIAELRQRVLNVKLELGQKQKDYEILRKEFDAYRQQTGDRDSEMRHLRQERDTLDTQLNDANNKLKRLQNMRMLNNENIKQDLDQVRLQLHLVENENSQLKKELGDKNLKGAGAIKQWEGDKKLERMLSNSRDKLNEKDSENDKLQKQLNSITRALERMKKEKQTLEKRLTDKWGPGALLGMDDMNGDMDDLIRENNRLKREVEQLNGATKEFPSVKDVSVKEAEIRNRILQKNIDDLEHRLVQSGNTSGIQLEKERSMQKEIIRLNGENLQLKFEVDSSRKEIPRLKEKITDQQKYIDLLKSEKEMADHRSNKSIESTASTISNIRKIGESGKSSYELEKTVSRLKKLVEKTQRENERLKEAPGIVMHEQLDFIRSENDRLKQELDELRQQMGSRLAERYDVKEKGIARMSQDYEKMRRDLTKEYQEHEKTRIDLKQMVREVEKLERIKTDLETKLELAESRSKQSGSRRAASDLVDENRRLQMTVDKMQNQLKEYQESASLANSDNMHLKLQQLMEHNTFLQRQLQNFSEQFGVSVDLRP